MTWLLRILALLSVLCLAATGVSYWYLSQPPRVQPNFTVTPTEINWPDCPVGVHDLTLAITNPASVPRRIIGLAEG